MPAMYAHYILGQDALPLMDVRAKRVIEAHHQMFNVGLQGPDFYFFDQMEYLRGKSFAKIGRKLHNEPCENLLKYLQANGGSRFDGESLAYILGLIGHFSLDSTCHPHIDHWVKTLPYDHMRMETEFDRFLLERDGYHPRRFPLGNCVAADQRARMKIGALYDGYGTAKEVACLIKEYAMIKNMIRTPVNVQYFFYQGVLSIVQIRRYIGGVFMGPKDQLSTITNPRLLMLFEEAKKLYIRLVANYLEYYLHDAPLDVYFKRDFEVLPCGEVLDEQ